MYICKSKTSSPNSGFAQRELNDYIGDQRTIVFDLDDPSEAEKARRVLRPKGISPKRRSKTAAATNLSQKALAFQGQKPRTSRKTSRPQETEAPQNHSDGLAQATLGSMVGNQHKTLERKAHPPKLKSPAQTMDKGAPERKKGAKDKKKARKKGRPKPKPKRPAISENKAGSDKEPSEENRGGPPVPEGKPPIRAQESAGDSPLITPTDTNRPDPSPGGQIAALRGYLLQLAEEVGFGGEINITCPFCGEEHFFDYADIDRHTLKSARYCDCGTVLRLSILEFNRKIFADIQVPVSGAKTSTRKQVTPIQDENGNTLIVHAQKISL